FLCTPIYNIGQVSLRQAITPDRVQGRMNATMRTVVWGTLPVGAFLGGILGSVIGILPTMYIGAAVTTAAAFWLLLGPLRLKEAAGGDRGHDRGDPRVILHSSAAGPRAGPGACGPGLRGGLPRPDGAPCGRDLLRLRDRYRLAAARPPLPNPGVQGPRALELR